MALFMDNVCYLSNVGDSRAISSQSKGAKRITITIDHKPGNTRENDRIVKAGGKVYSSNVPRCLQDLERSGNKLDSSHETIYKCFGPERVYPGKLSVSRAIGDLYAKDPDLGGNPKVVIPNPDTYKLIITKDNDFLVLGSKIFASLVKNFIRRWDIRYAYHKPDHKNPLGHN